MQRPNSTAYRAPAAACSAAARSADADAVVRRAMTYFWREGYYASAVNDLAAEVGIAQNRLYTDFGGRQGLFLAAFKRYVSEIPMYGFQRLEGPLADARAVAAYFDAQADAAIDHGLPGPGCFITNTIVRTTPNNRAIRDVSDACVIRLRRGFENALSREARLRERDDAPVRRLSTFLTTASLGLWICAGHTQDPDDVRKFARAALDIMEEKLLVADGADGLSEACAIAQLEAIGAKL